jgi:Asp-tRNA(Asn)/Glu-tRNA(Gln) amidotransferase A subunit family amidase
MPPPPTPNGFPIVETTISQIHAAMEAGELSAQALVDAYLARIEAYDQRGPTLNCIVELNPVAREEAGRLDEHFAVSGTLAGALHGIPVLVKDNIETEQIPTSFGNEAFATYRPEADATAIVKLRRAGAIVLGKTAMPDFATSWWGYSSRSGETRNPYDLERDPGGSSSGTGAAISANLATVGLGTDCGGSVRLPCSFDNLVGVRCTPGMISRAGLATLLFFQDTIGPMARSVEDAARVFDVLVGYDAKDSLTCAYETARAPHSYTELLDPTALAGARLGLVTNVLGDPRDEGAAVNAVIDAGLDGARKEGAEIVELEIPDLAMHLAATSLYQNCSKHDINQFLASRPGAPVRSLQQLYESRRYHPKLDLLEACAFGPELPEHDPLYYRRLAAREEFSRVVLNLMGRHELDALVYPTVRVPAPTRKELDAGRWATMEFPTNTLIAAQCWMPAITVPAALVLARPGCRSGLRS